jgi:hypothetical protein
VTSDAAIHGKRLVRRQLHGNALLAGRLVSRRLVLLATASLTFLQLLRQTQLRHSGNHALATSPAGGPAAGG